MVSSPACFRRRKPHFPPLVHACDQSSVPGQKKMSQGNVRTKGKRRTVPMSGALASLEGGQRALADPPEFPRDHFLENTEGDRWLALSYRVYGFRASERPLQRTLATNTFGVRNLCVLEPQKTAQTQANLCANFSCWCQSCE